MRFGTEQPGYFLYPTSDDVAWLIAAREKELSPYFKLYTPPIKSLVSLLDKASLHNEAEAAGLDVPETVVPRSEAEVERCFRDRDFPVYVKSRTQVFVQRAGKGMRVNNPSKLCSAWRAQIDGVAFAPEVLNQVPDIRLPIIQRTVSATERIYTVDGFVDETGDLRATLACVKLLQRPRGSGAGIIFEHAEIDPAIDEGLRRLFHNTGFYGVFDAEFLETGSRKLLIDINPRYYNHMQFEIERGLHLPWLTYLAATGNRETLKAEIAKSNDTSISRHAYVHRLPTNLLLAVQRFTGRMSAEDVYNWRRRIEGYGGSVTDPIRTLDDPAPARAEIAMEIFAAVRHPRGYLRRLVEVPE